jgi:hypothetical protein
VLQDTTKIFMGTRPSYAGLAASALLGGADALPQHLYPALLGATRSGIDQMVCHLRLMIHWSRHFIPQKWCSRSSSGGAAADNVSRQMWSSDSANRCAASLPSLISWPQLSQVYALVNIS